MIQPRPAGTTESCKEAIAPSENGIFLLPIALRPAYTLPGTI